MLAWSLLWYFFCSSSLSTWKGEATFCKINQTRNVRITSTKVNATIRSRIYVDAKGLRSLQVIKERTEAKQSMRG